MKYYFYCPNCEYEEVVTKLPKGTIGNCRDGWGTPIHHFECSKCHNLDAGYMAFGVNAMSELTEEEQKEYFQHVIGMYQNIRGIKERSKINEI